MNVVYWAIISFAKLIKIFKHTTLQRKNKLKTALMITIIEGMAAIYQMLNITSEKANNYLKR